MEIGIGTIDLDGFVPDDRLQAQLGLPVKFDECGLVLRVHKPKGMDAETFHEPKRARDSPVGHHPHDHVHAFGGEVIKSQKLSCADCAWGKAQSGSSFTAWIRSGNLIASWMKKTGILLPTMSQLPSCV